MLADSRACHAGVERDGADNDAQSTLTDAIRDVRLVSGAIKARRSGSTRVDGPSPQCALS